MEMFDSKVFGAAKPDEHDRKMWPHDFPLGLASDPKWLNIILI